MTKENDVDFRILDVGSGPKPKGDVNVCFLMNHCVSKIKSHDREDFDNSQEISNFLVADLMHLPFKDESFDVAYSSHAIERIQNPFLMFREMCRVAKRKVIVQCWHRKGSAAKRRNYKSSFDEAWFRKATDVLGFKNNVSVTAFDYPITSKLEKISPNILHVTLPWKTLKRIEKSRLMKEIHIPLEMEVWVTKRGCPANTNNVKFVVVYNIPEIFEKSFASSLFVSKANILAYYNVNNEPLPKFYNRTIQEHLQENVWFIFCHQDFILKEDLSLRLKDKNVEAIYGPIGSISFARENFSGMIIQTNRIPVGDQLEKDVPVRTLDEMCLIAHAEIFRRGLIFDEKFQFHFYGADLCMQAYALGFDVFAMQLNCQHKSRTIIGDTSSLEYNQSLDLFRKKWKQFLPVRTTTKGIT